MAEELSDLELRERREKGIELTLADLFVQLRIAKASETAWIIAWQVLGWLLIGYFWLWIEEESLDGFEAVVISVVYLIITLGLYRDFYKGRQNRFTILRAIRRAQNYYRIAGSDFPLLPPAHRNFVFPEGFGEKAARDLDGTNRWAWCQATVNRLAVLDLLFILIVFRQSSFLKISPIVLFLLFAVIHFVAIVFVLNRDRAAMTRHLMEERDLVGSDPNDYPPTSSSATP